LPHLKPEFDAVIDRFYTTIPWQERMDALREIIRHASDQMLVMGMFCSTEAKLVSNRVEEAAPIRMWNVHQWTVR
jgi:hypothetical protein